MYLQCLSSLREHSLLGEVSPTVRLVSSFTSVDSTASLHTNKSISSVLVSSSLVKLVTSRTAILPPTLSVLCTVTRFGKISPLWQKFTGSWQILTVYFLFGKMLSLLWQICDIIGLTFIVANGQTLKNNLTICSYWFSGSFHSSSHRIKAPFDRTKSVVVVGLERERVQFYFLISFLSFSSSSTSFAPLHHKKCARRPAKGMGTYMGTNQCDQIRQNFATWRNLKIFGIF